MSEKCKVYVSPHSGLEECSNIQEYKEYPDARIMVAQLKEDFYRTLINEQVYQLSDKDYEFIQEQATKIAKKLKRKLTLEEYYNLLNNYLQ